MENAASIDKAIDVLFYLHRAPSACGVTAIGRALGIPKSSVHRLLAAWVRGGLVERTGGEYRPGLGLLALGLGVLEREPVVVGGRPVLEEFASRLGETLFLVSAHGGGLRVLDKVEGQGFLRAAPQIGGQVPVHATAVGKLYLAFAKQSLSESEADARRPFTDRTLTGAVELAHEVERIRDRGVAWNRDEWISGLSVVAAPVQMSGRMLAAVAIALPTSRLPELGEERLAAEVKAAARHIGERLSGDRMAVSQSTE